MDGALYVNRTIFRRVRSSSRALLPPPPPSPSLHRAMWTRRPGESIPQGIQFTSNKVIGHVGSARLTARPVPRAFPACIPHLEEIRDRARIIRRFCSRSRRSESFIHLGAGWRALSDDRKVAWEIKTARQPASFATLLILPGPPGCSGVSRA